MKVRVLSTAALVSLVVLPREGVAQQKLSPFAPISLVTQAKNKTDFQLEEKDAGLSGAMKRVGDTVVGTIPEQLRENNRNTAKFVINSPHAQDVDIYFLANAATTKRTHGTSKSMARAHSATTI